MTETDKALAERVIELSEKATAGPWTAEIWMNFDEGGYAAIGPHHKQEEDDDDCEPSSACGNKAKQDADFIAFTRNHAPQLALTVLTQAERIAELEREARAFPWEKAGKVPRLLKELATLRQQLATARTALHEISNDARLSGSDCAKIAQATLTQLKTP